MKALCGKKALLYQGGVIEKEDELKITFETYINISGERANDKRETGSNAETLEGRK